mmetsp:Transcript_122469/g.357590  ORF Transcript_122469/g.357590 Transcript_122469/m.357590 type:complete len:235 (+) Transcript_122469:1282-1986(+)
MPVIVEAEILHREQPEVLVSTSITVDNRRRVIDRSVLIQRLAAVEDPLEALSLALVQLHHLSTSCRAQAPEVVSHVGVAWLEPQRLLEVPPGERGVGAVAGVLGQLHAREAAAVERLHGLGIHGKSARGVVHRGGKIAATQVRQRRIEVQRKTKLRRALLVRALLGDQCKQPFIVALARISVVPLVEALVSSLAASFGLVVRIRSLNLLLEAGLGLGLVAGAGSFHLLLDLNHA